MMLHQKFDLWTKLNAFTVSDYDGKQKPFTLLNAFTVSDIDGKQKTFTLLVESSIVSSYDFPSIKLDWSAN